MNLNVIKPAALLFALLTLGGCANTLQPLDYKASTAYVPVTLGLGQAYSRIDEQHQRETISALKNTGAFSMLDGGFSRNGYSLLITEPHDGKVNWLALMNVFTLFTFPMPYHYQDNLRGSVFKDGELLKTYNYSREGWSVISWYVPIPAFENKRQMLDQLLVEMDKDKVIPYQP
ncbi:hypothetical protein FGA82_01170 [Pseudomonas fluorescens]|uniref:hypothetical protein n=1 Tax=Pseudomonas fluorescens TaxID=294 RepID=UPI001131800D|nr:hypothetical protein [Pseudomonas fluorescens]TMU83257.1 hypothetical protein FGA82_01170 [Pseudomonas fluorescens]